jgi:hypothetical protein
MHSHPALQLGGIEEVRRHDLGDARVRAIDRITRQRRTQAERIGNALLELLSACVIMMRIAAHLLEDATDEVVAVSAIDVGLAGSPFRGVAQEMFGSSSRFGVKPTDRKG